MRERRFFVLGTLVVAGLAGAVSERTAWGQRPLGIDVSKWQPTVDWNQVYASGRVFAFIKA
ncbi:MAG TPA: hypothetical protein PLQ89_12105, partial [Phycisphaerae bacterium]|nr:hypothetical protein [Phycisphaerae bacterium]